MYVMYFCLHFHYPFSSGPLYKWWEREVCVCLCGGSGGGRIRFARCFSQWLFSLIINVFLKKVFVHDFFSSTFPCTMFFVIFQLPFSTTFLMVRLPIFLNIMEMRIQLSTKKCDIHQSSFFLCKSSPQFFRQYMTRPYTKQIAWPRHSARQTYYEIIWLIQHVSINKASSSKNVQVVSSSTIDGRKKSGELC